MSGPDTSMEVCCLMCHLQELGLTLGNDTTRTRRNEGARKPLLDTIVGYRGILSEGIKSRFGNIFIRTLSEVLGSSTLISFATQVSEVDEASFNSVFCGFPLKKGEINYTHSAWKVVSLW